MSASRPLNALAATLRAEGTLLARAVSEPAPDAVSPHGDAASGGPRATGNPGEYALLVEAVREGYECHYGSPRVLTTDDPDLALLAGDRLYALGLDRLAELGDLAAVVELANLIAASAQAHAEGDADRAEAAWGDSARAVGHGR